MWKCKKCNEDNEDSFDACWNCQTFSRLESKELTQTEKMIQKENQKLAKENQTLVKENNNLLQEDRKEDNNSLLGFDIIEQTSYLFKYDINKTYSEIIKEFLRRLIPLVVLIFVISIYGDEKATPRIIINFFSIITLVIGFSTFFSIIGFLSIIIRKRKKSKEQ